MPKDITEDLPYDLTRVASEQSFALSNVAYDVSINDLGFIIKANSDTPYKRETAQYKKDQFDNATEPGEQTLTGWWVRSQTSWHLGAGIRYYEPGTDPGTQYRFYDSRGVDIWTKGEVSLLKDTFHLYPSSGTAAGKIIATAGNDGTNDCLVIGDSLGVLRKVTYNGDSAGTVYTGGSYASLASGHNSGSVDNFVSITNDGTYYYAMCERAIHRGRIDGTGTDVAIKHTSSAPVVGKAVIKYAKGFLIASSGRGLYEIPEFSTTSSVVHNSGADLTGVSNKMSHPNDQWVWTSITGGLSHIYASGYAGSTSEIWKIPYTDNGSTASTTFASLNLSRSSVVAQLPYGEIVKSIEAYLGYLVIGTSLGIRIATVNNDGTITYGPLLFESNYPVNGFVFNGTYVYAATTAISNNIPRAILVRVDLGAPNDDGTFPYAYDMEYESDEISEATGVFILGGRLTIVTEEGGNGELIGQYLTQRRASGWLETGYVRYGTVEGKYFKYLKANGLLGNNDTITLSTVDVNGTVADIVPMGISVINNDVNISSPSGAQEIVAFKFTLNNNSPISTYPTLLSYQIKAVPAAPRQRLYQYPLSCFDKDMDRFNVSFGYEGRAYDLISALESLETLSDFVTVIDYRTNESYQGIIEEVSFNNESSPDKGSSGLGGTLLVTIRKY